MNFLPQVQLQLQVEKKFLIFSLSSELKMWKKFCLPIFSSNLWKKSFAALPRHNDEWKQKFSRFANKGKSPQNFFANDAKWKLWMLIWFAHQCMRENFRKIIFIYLEIAFMHFFCCWLIQQLSSICDVNNKVWKFNKKSWIFRVFPTFRYRQFVTWEI